MTNPSTSDLLSIETLLNSASWEVGIGIAPSCERSEDRANDDAPDAEVRS